jgi:hypothetical protein
MKLLWIFAIAAVVVTAPANANADLRACSVGAGGPLHETDVGVFDYPSSFINPDGLTVPFVVYSLSSAKFETGDPVPAKSGIYEPVDMCLRYEIKNLSDDLTIRDLRWLEIRLAWYDFPIGPGEQSPGWLLDFTDVMSEPNDYTTIIRAFRDKKAEVRALFARRSERVQAHADSVLSPYDTSNDLAYAMLGQKFDLSPVQVIASAPEQAYPDLISDIVPIEGVSVTIRSSLDNVDNVVSLKYDVTASESIQVSAPLFGALKEFKPKPQTDATIVIVKAIDDFVYSDYSEGLYDFTIDYPVGSADFNGSAAFIVTHPVTIWTEIGEACILVDSYSPVPINIPDNRCRLSDEVIEIWSIPQ